MRKYEGFTAGEIRICYDKRRLQGRWYAKVPIYDPKLEQAPEFKRLLAEKSALEIALSGPEIIKANKKIIAALESKGISTRQLTIRPYEKSQQS